MPVSVRLLFDENLSPTHVSELADIFPQSAHVRDLRLQSAPDEAIWHRAAADGFIIVTKDDDFRQRSFLYGFPPKVIWLHIGNCRREVSAAVLRNAGGTIQAFADDVLSALLILVRPS